MWGLAIAPPDYLQGNSFRIMYLHVPAAILSESCYILMGVAGAVLLIWRMKLADMVVAAAAPIGVVFCIVALLTGSIWGRPTWGTWWVWDARTTSMLVLLFLYFGVMALRQAVPREETAGRAAAILAVVGMVDIPIIKYSVDWWLTLHQTVDVQADRGAVDAEPRCICRCSSACSASTRSSSACCCSASATKCCVRERRTQWVNDLVGSRQS